MDITNQKQLQFAAVALQRLELLRKQEAFDPNNLESKPTAKQQEVFDDFGRIPQQWIRAGNQSGKSQVCAWEVAHVAAENHPTWTRPTNWGTEPLLIIVAGRTGKQIEDSLLPKIRSFLQQGTYKEVRIGNIIQRLEIIDGTGAGNRIVFQSLENPTVARERLQSYVAHMTWCDELPPTMELVRELLIRTQARNGYSMFSFTPTVLNVEIQRYVDSLKEPEGKVYRFHMLDNPLYSEPKRRGELLGRYAHLPEEQQRMIFEGEWLSGDDQVYYFNWQTMVEMPEGYSPLWRHVESVDPALKSALGLTIWAENPKTAVWYCIKAEYIRGIYVPTDLVEAVRKQTEGYNIVRRIADPHEVWYIQTAGSRGISYMGVYKKNERKSELIKGLQQCLGPRIKLTPLVMDTIGVEIQECRWSSKTDGKIVNASSYHLLDSAQYFADNIPKFEQAEKVLATTWQDYLYQQNEKRKLSIDKQQKKQVMKMMQRRRRRTM